MRRKDWSLLSHFSAAQLRPLRPEPSAQELRMASSEGGTGWAAPPHPSLAIGVALRPHPPE